MATGWCGGGTAITIIGGAVLSFIAVGVFGALAGAVGLSIFQWLDQRAAKRHKQQKGLIPYRGEPNEDFRQRRQAKGYDR